MASSDANNLKELKWVSLNQPEFQSPSAADKFHNKFLQNPLVPVGAIVTTASLTMGIYNLYKGDSKKQQIMMRSRVLAQGFTFAAMLGGLLLAGNTKIVYRYKNGNVDN